jgi:hypothetical protein
MPEGMAISYGTSGGGRTTSKSFEYIAVQDQNGVVQDNILKYSRIETTDETVESTFGAGTLDGNEVLNATITASVDEVVIEAGTEATTPQRTRFYNPKQECSATFLGSANVSGTFSFDGKTFDTVSSEVSETLGDVKKVTVRGILYANDGLAAGASSGVIRKEKRFSNTDFVRTTSTSVSFGGS